MELRLHWAHHLLLPCEPSSARAARLFSRNMLTSHRVEHLAGAAEIVISELATNSIVHARTPFGIAVTGDSLAVIVRVRDQSSAPPVPRPFAALNGPGEPNVSGRGLALVDTFASDWGVQFNNAGDGKTVWASFLTF